jgi:Na+/H+ antiporter NhaD/arsenite permease-like protein
MVLGICLFVFAYALIAGPRLRVIPIDRPTGALVGGLAFVFAGVLTPAQAMSAVNLDTLVLLFGLMGVGAFLEQQGLLQSFSDWALSRFLRPSALLGALVWGAGGLSALITNDAVCVLGTPLVVSWIKRRNLPALPFLLALATAANTGSVATLVGNPQNMLCGLLGGLSYRSYLWHVWPVAIVCLALNHAILAWMFRRQLFATTGLTEVNGVADERPFGVKHYSTLVVLFFSVVSYTAGTSLPVTAVAAFSVLLLFHRASPADVWQRIDWSVLVFFCGLFVVVQGLVKSGGAAVFLSWMPLSTSDMGLPSTLKNAALFLLGSNVVSNVPFILVIQGQMSALPNSTYGWELLAMASTFAGNMTLLGSVANIIVAEGGRDVGGMGFGKYLKVGLPLAVSSTMIGATWLWFLHSNF